MKIFKIIQCITRILFVVAATVIWPIIAIIGTAFASDYETWKRIMWTEYYDDFYPFYRKDL